MWKELASRPSYRKVCRSNCVKGPFFFIKVLSDFLRHVPGKMSAVIFEHKLLFFYQTDDPKVLLLALKQFCFDCVHLFRLVGALCHRHRWVGRRLRDWCGGT